MQVWASCSEGRTAACSPHAQGGDQCCVAPTSSTSTTTCSHAVPSHSLSRHVETDSTLLEGPFRAGDERVSMAFPVLVEKNVLDSQGFLFLGQSVSREAFAAQIKEAMHTVAVDPSHSRNRDVAPVFI